MHRKKIRIGRRLGYRYIHLYNIGWHCKVTKFSFKIIFLVIIQQMGHSQVIDIQRELDSSRQRVHLQSPQITPSGCGRDESRPYNLPVYTTFCTLKNLKKFYMVFLLLKKIVSNFAKVSKGV